MEYSKKNITVKTLTYLLCTLVLTLGACSAINQDKQKQATTEQSVKVEIKDPVYICKSPWAECYHKYKDCEGLDNCGGAILIIELSEAQNMGRRPCGYCAK